MLRLSRNSGWSFRRDAISCNSGLEGVTSSVVVGIVIDRERRLACRSLIALSKLPSFLNWHSFPISSKLSCCWALTLDSTSMFIILSILEGIRTLVTKFLGVGSI
ncbi:hypothetical protein DAI22_11g186580 [Oryza sativa Japonica Group]|nr:hypothetical protein DAI22_11g186580 [Oryza sativa Japonica Group]